MVNFAEIIKIFIQFVLFWQQKVKYNKFSDADYGDFGVLTQALGGKPP